LAAAALNAIWLSAEKRPPTFVAAAVDIPAGQEVTSEMLAPVPVPGNVDKLRESLIPFDSKATLLGRKAARAYVKGDVFFQRDIDAVRQLAEFEVLGPFKLISVGARFTEVNAKADDSQLDTAGNNITIEVSAKFDDRTRKLLETVDPTRSPRDDNRARIVAIQVIPKEDQKAAAEAETKDVVYQTISLEGITNVPRVLLAGDVIRFVVPAHGSL
jgi:hypothetical protein